MDAVPAGAPASLIQRLLASDEPSVRLRLVVDVLRSGAGRELDNMREQVRRSRRVATLLSERDGEGRIPARAYAKWYGAHWVLVTLAELGYPPGDATLVPLRDQIYDWLFSTDYQRHIGRVRGLPRMHASIDGNAVWAALRLGIADERADLLVNRLICAQWPDGGWNCDRRASGTTSSFAESLIPLRALALHARLASSDASASAARRAAELFLSRRLFRCRRDGRVMSSSFLELHYPCYWHYDILFALTVLAEAGQLRDGRTHEALDALRAKRLPDGGFPAEHRYYRHTDRVVAQRSLVGWGPTSKRTSNEWVTVAALAVLRAAEPLS